MYKAKIITQQALFQITLHRPSTFQLKIKEAIHIQQEKPKLNHEILSC